MPGCGRCKWKPSQHLLLGKAVNPEVWHNIFTVDTPGALFDPFYGIKIPTQRGRPFQVRMMSDLKE